MQIVIEIPTKTNEHIRADYGHGCKCLRDEDLMVVVSAIYNGTILPKHGRLIDADVLIKEYGKYDIGVFVNKADTILETDMVEPQESEDKE